MFGVDQPVRPTGVEAQHPIVNRLQANAPNPSRLTARAPVINLGHSQKPPQLTGITRAPRQSATCLSVTLRLWGCMFSIRLWGCMFSICSS